VAELRAWRRRPDSRGHRQARSHRTTGLSQENQSACCRLDSARERRSNLPDVAARGGQPFFLIEMVDALLERGLKLRRPDLSQGWCAAPGEASPRSLDIEQLIAGPHRQLRRGAGDRRVTGEWRAGRSTSRTANALK
jgi:hypothetical protein